MFLRPLLARHHVYFPDISKVAKSRLRAYSIRGADALIDFLTQPAQILQTLALIGDVDEVYFTRGSRNNMT